MKTLLAQIEAIIAQVDTETIEQIIAMLDACEAAMYAASGKRQLAVIEDRRS